MATKILYYISSDASNKHSFSFLPHSKLRVFFFFWETQQKMAGTCTWTRWSRLAPKQTVCITEPQSATYSLAHSKTRLTLTSFSAGSWTCGPQWTGQQQCCNVLCRLPHLGMFSRRPDLPEIRRQREPGMQRGWTPVPLMGNSGYRCRLCRSAPSSPVRTTCKLQHVDKGGK